MGWTGALPRYYLYRLVEVWVAYQCTSIVFVCLFVCYEFTLLTESVCVCLLKVCVCASVCDKLFSMSICLFFNVYGGSEYGDIFVYTSLRVNVSLCTCVCVSYMSEWV